MFNTDVMIIVSVLLFAFFGVGIVFARLYQRASKEISFVRTGFGGQQVIMDGGALVFPVLHEVIKVNMNTIRLVVSRQNEQALITNDRMRVDVTAEFYLRVKPDIDAIAFAAQTLGQRTMSPDQLKELMEGKFVDALRSVAAEMGMEELHEKRSDFVQKVQNAVTADLEKNGLELETVSLTALDQTDKRYFNPDNAFDAQGLTKLTETIESKKKVRNDIEQTTSVEIRRKNLQAEKERLELDKEESFAKSIQQREISNQSAIEAANIATQKFENDRKASEADIEAKRQVETARIKASRQIEEERISNELAVKEKDIDRARATEIAEQVREIAVAEKSMEKSRTDKLAKIAEAEAVEAAERVITAKEKEIANRNKEIAVILARQEAEKDAVSVRVAAEAEKSAAFDNAEAVKTRAQAEADAIKIKAAADELRYKVEAEGQQKLNEAENKLSKEILEQRIKLETIRYAPQIIEASVKPISAIDGMKVINVSGLNGYSSNSNGNEQGSGNGNGSNIGEQLVNSLLKYRSMAPVVDSILKEVGLDASSISGLTHVLQNEKPSLEAPKNESKKELK